MDPLAYASWVHGGAPLFLARGSLWFGWCRHREIHALFLESRWQVVEVPWKP